MNFDRALQAANVLRAGGNVGVDFRLMRNLNCVSDADVAQVLQVGSHANGIAALLDGRIRKGVVEALLRVVDSKPGGANFAMHVHLAIRTSRNVHVAGCVGKLEANGASDVETAVEIAGYGCSRV